MDMQSPALLSDSELLARTARLAHGERRATASLVAHLAEIETRRLYLGEACSSLFTYCIRVLRLSEPAAYNRIQAARAVRRFPAVLAHLEQGHVHLAAVKLLAPVLTAENHHELLVAATHKSKREVEELVARWRPQPDVPGKIRKLPAVQSPAVAAAAAAAAAAVAKATPMISPQPPQAGTAGDATSAGDAIASGVLGAAALFTRAPDTAEPHGRPEESDLANPRRAGVGPVGGGSTSPRAEVVPLAPERYKVQFTAGAATREKLRRAQELLRHRIPDGDVATVIDLALGLLVQQLEKKKFAATEQPRPNGRGAAAAPGSPPFTASTPLSPLPPASPAASASLPLPASASSASRYIRAEVRRAVWERDQGQCAFVTAAGERCTERARLEFDHILPHADGGCAEVQNLRLLCRPHNQYAAQQFFGPWHAEDAAESAAR